MKSSTDKEAVIALILGILGLIMTLEPGVFLGVLGGIACIVGLFISISARRRLPKGNSNRGLATAGLILSIIGIVFAGMGVMCSACALATIGAVTFSQFIF